MLGFKKNNIVLNPMSSLYVWGSKIKRAIKDLWRSRDFFSTRNYALVGGDKNKKKRKKRNYASNCLLKELAFYKVNDWLVFCAY